MWVSLSHCYILTGVLLCNVAQKIQISQVIRSAISLPPHVFVKVARYHFLRRPMHPLEIGLDAAPITFHTVCMASSGWINEVAAVVDRPV